MRYALLLALAAGPPAPAGAQAIPDTTAPWRYFPMEVGNAWQYRHVTTRDGEVIAQYVFGRDIVGEAVLEGHRYFAVRYCSQQPSSALVCEAPEAYDFVRLDTTRSAVVQRVEEAGQPPREVWWAELPCALGAPFNASGIGCGSSSAPGYHTGGGYGQEVTVGGEIVRGVSRKTFVSSSLQELASGLGLLSHVFCAYITGAETCFSWTLSYAFLGGHGVGTPLFSFPVAAEPGPEPARLGLAVGPNPAAGAARATFRLDHPAEAGVEVLDLLGRRVLALDLGRLPEGDHAATLDLSVLAPGVYVLRLTAGAASASRALVRRD